MSLVVVGNRDGEDDEVLRSVCAGDGDEKYERTW